MSNELRVTRRLLIPDPVRIRRYQSLPEQGPRVLFFSGGSALNKVSRVLKGYTHNSIHLVTPFDSGGSSARLRAEFDMPAVGDLRSRLMVLADETVMGQPEIYALFTHRFASNADQEGLKSELSRLVWGTHPLIESISNPMRALIQTQLAVIQSRIRESFDLRGASIGNLIISGGYLNNQQQLDPIVFLFAKLVEVLGEVKTTIDASYHLGVELENGEIVLGQHRITGKEYEALSVPIKRIWLNQGLKCASPVNRTIAEDRRDVIENADLICYPPGSFYSSLLANLLPQGVGSAICKNPNPKVYLPNLGEDPEQLGLSLMMQIDRLRHVVYQDVSQTDTAAFRAMDYLLLDQNYHYGVVDTEALKTLGIHVIKADLIGDKKNRYNEHKVVQALLSLT